MSAVIMNNISKLINQRIILNNANLKLDKGEICALIGPNGAGKTTLLKCLLGLINKDTGSISVDRIKVQLSSLNQILPKFGVVLKYPESISQLSIKTLFDQHQHYMGIKRNRSIHSLLSEVDLNVSLYQEASELSLGMSQRLLLALAISHNPSILILDEPFNGLDISGVNIFKKIINKFKSQGKSVLLTSHSLENLDGLVDSVIFINHGKTAHKISAKVIQNKYGNIQNYYKEMIDHE